MEIFEISSVARILMVKPSRIKNWTIGRPFAVKPTIQTAKGKGSRNLYSVEDVNMFALINQLLKDGISARTIKLLLKMIPQASLTATSVEGHPWWIISISGKNVLLDRSTSPLLSFTEEDFSGKYILNIYNLLNWVSRRIVREQVGLLKGKEK